MYDDVARAAGSTDRGRHVRPRRRRRRGVGTVLHGLRQPQHRLAPPHVAIHAGWCVRPPPRLKYVPTEIRLDWIPATLRHLDAIYEDERSHLPAKRKPSEYWQTNCLAGASFIHKAEVEMRHEIGVETILFGRDFPHSESTWPHTREWLRDAFAGVPEDELRLMLGENAIRFFDLDRTRLARDRPAHRPDRRRTPCRGRGPSRAHRQLRHARWLSQAGRGRLQAADGRPAAAERPGPLARYLIHWRRSGRAGTHARRAWGRGQGGGVGRREGDTRQPARCRR